MCKRKIEITVTPTGVVMVGVKGYKGQSCFDASRDIEHALGEQVGPATRTGEYYQVAANEQHERTSQ